MKKVLLASAVALSILGYLKQLPKLKKIKQSQYAKM